MSEAENDQLKIWPGRHVELELKTETGETERLSLDVVEDAAADFARGFLGSGTALGQAILGKQAGSVVAYRAGDIVEVRVLAVTAKLSAEPEDLTGRRAEVTRKAVESSDQTSLIIYASAMNSKWGDYDPSILQPDEESEPPEPDTPDKGSAA